MTKGLEELDRGLGTSASLLISALTGLSYRSQSFLKKDPAGGL
jgi:mevalonate kinase